MYPPTSSTGELALMWPLPLELPPEPDLRVSLPGTVSTEHSTETRTSLITLTVDLPFHCSFLKYFQQIKISDPVPATSNSGLPAGETVVVLIFITEMQILRVLTEIENPARFFPSFN